MKLVSLNTWKCDGGYANRLRAMVDELQPLQPDVLLFQEVFSSVDGQWDTAHTLARALGLHAWVEPARRKVRWVEGAARLSDSGMAMLSRWPFLHQQRLPLPSCSSDGERIAQVACLDTPDGRMALGNLHLSHLPGGGALRAAQLREVISAASAMARADAGLIAGDFNASLDSAELRPFLDGPWHLRDAFAGHVPAKYTHVDSDGRALDLDHALFLPTPGDGRHIRLERATIVMTGSARNGVAPSDHAGLYLELALCNA